MNPFFGCNGDALSENSFQINAWVLGHQPDGEFNISVLEGTTSDRQFFQLSQQDIYSIDVLGIAFNFDLVFPGGYADFKLFFD